MILDYYTDINYEKLKLFIDAGLRLDSDSPSAI